MHTGSYASAHSLSRGNLSKFLTSQLSNENEDAQKIIKIHLKFDHRKWWKTHGDVVRSLLEGGNHFEAINSSAHSSSQTMLSIDHFEKTYATDSIYQDLFIDCPPCRDTLKLSFHLINRYWKIKVIEWNPPSLMTTIPSCTLDHNDKKSSETLLNNQQLNNFSEIEAIGTRPNDNNAFFLRVFYTAKQRPRLSFLPSLFCERLEFEYEGWVDLYLRPTTALKSCDSDEHISHWQVHRHDDRLRVKPPGLLFRWNDAIKKHMKDENSIDALTVIEQITFISTIFQWFRWAHGVTVQHFAKKKIKNGT